MGTSRVFAVASGKGGVGKTTTAVNLGASFAEAGRTTVVVDVDLGMANVGDVLDLDASTSSLHDVLSGRATLAVAIQPAPGEFDVIAGSPDFESFGRADPSGLGDVVDDLREEYDVIVLDTGGGLSYDNALPLGLADEVLLVTTPDAAALSNTATTRDLVDRLDGSVRGVVLNRIDGSAGATQDGARSRLDLSIVGSVPEDVSVPESAAEGVPVVVADRDSPAAQSFREIAYSLLGEPLPRDWSDENVATAVSATTGQASTSADADGPEPSAEAAASDDADAIAEATATDAPVEEPPVDAAASAPDEGGDNGRGEPADEATADEPQAGADASQAPASADDLDVAEETPLQETAAEEVETAVDELTGDEETASDDAADDASLEDGERASPDEADEASTDDTDEVSTDDTDEADDPLAEADEDASADDGASLDDGDDAVEADETGGEGDGEVAGDDASDADEESGPGIADAIESAESDPEAATGGSAIEESAGDAEEAEGDEESQSLLSKLTGGLFG